ncbi:hypothetical protein ACFCXS_36380 [Streptomyces sp. NPDC056373]|uniref:hypothetical protein n=1 Tax=Streptomyces sp. NPDC056373 TaxID=3345798 RepID=UPI0035DFEF21
MGVEAGAQVARARALAVLRIRSRALAVALLPAAVAVILLAGAAGDRLEGPGWDAARAVLTPVAALVLLAAAGIALVVARARPAMSPTVPVAEEAAPDLYRMVRDLADRLDVPAPSAIALTPDCDSWLEDRTHRSHAPPPVEEHQDIAGAGKQAQRRQPVAPVLVIGSPFLWWMRVGELRAVLAPVIAGTGPSAHPDIAAARRFVRGLDAAVAVASEPRRDPLSRAVLAGVGRVARLLLRGCRIHAAEMERGVAAAAAERAQAVDYGLRIVAQEQVGLAYAGWDRLLTRVALPAWRMGRWPSRLDAGVVAALTELSRRDRLAEGFASRLGERPACDLLEEPGTVDEAASLLAARLFHGGPATPGPDWSPVDWSDYPDEVVDRKWRLDAARLHRVLDAMGVRPATGPASSATDAPTLSRVLDHLTATGPAGTTGTARAGGPAAPPPAEPAAARTAERTAEDRTAEQTAAGPTAGPAHPPGSRPDTAPPEAPGTPDPGPGGTTSTTTGISTSTTSSPTSTTSTIPGTAPDTTSPDLLDDEDLSGTTAPSATLAARLSAELAREEAAPSPAGPPAPASPSPTTDLAALWDDRALPLFPLQPPRTARELLADHLTAMVCCAAMDTAGATPGLDWLDGPTLLVDGERTADLAPKILTLIEDGDAAPLRVWLSQLGIRPEKPVRLG